MAALMTPDQKRDQLRIREQVSRFRDIISTAIHDAESLVIVLSPLPSDIEKRAIQDVCAELQKIGWVTSQGTNKVVIKAP